MPGTVAYDNFGDVLWQMEAGFEDTQEAVRTRKVRSLVHIYVLAEADGDLLPSQGMSGRGLVMYHFAVPEPNSLALALLAFWLSQPRRRGGGWRFASH